MPSEFTTIYSDDTLRLARPHHTKLLIVHLGTPGPILDVGAHSLEYDKIELHGTGQFRIMRNGIQPREGRAVPAGPDDDREHPLDVADRIRWISSRYIEAQHEARQVADKARVRSVVSEAFSSVSSLSGESFPQRVVEDIATRVAEQLATSAVQLSDGDRDTLHRMRDRATRGAREYRGWPTQAMYDVEVALLDRILDSHRSTVTDAPLAPSDPRP